MHIFTDKTEKDNIVLRLRFENTSVSVDGIGTLQIDTQYFYSNEKREKYALTGIWNLVNRETGKKNKAYALKFLESGLFLYTHPHINGKDVIIDRGIWRAEKEVLSVKIGCKKDIFSFKVEEQVLNLTKLIKTANATNIFPWRVKQTDKYMKSGE